MDAALLLKGLAIGLVFGVPIGAVGALTVQRAVERGPRAGLASGLGCAAADALYAVVSVCGLPLVAAFLEENRAVIGIVGGIALVALGAYVARLRPAPERAGREDAGLAALFGSSFAIAASSPSTVLVFLFAFSVFEVGELDGPLEGALLVGGIVTGASLWWVAVAQRAGALRDRVTQAGMRALNRACGAFVAAFGLLSAARSLLA